MDFEGRHKSTDTTSLRDLLSRLSTKSGAEDLRADEERERDTQQHERMKLMERSRSTKNKNFDKKKNFDRYKRSNSGGPKVSLKNSSDNKQKWDDYEYGDDDEYRARRDNEDHYREVQDAHDNEQDSSDDKHKWFQGRRGTQERNYHSDGKADGGAAFHVGSERSSGRKGETLAEYSRKNEEMYGSEASRNEYRKFYGLDD